MNTEIVLASASPRRKELLGFIFKNFINVASEVQESVPDDMEISSIPQYLAEVKARDVAEKYPDALVIGADTLVCLNGTALGKPKDCKQAEEMLCMLSGKTHSVITGCALIYKGKCCRFSSVTEVEFYNLTKQEITEYINTDEPYDKAGGYGIQSYGGLFVKRINGDYYNVVGLPVAELKRRLNKFLDKRDI